MGKSCIAKLAGGGMSNGGKVRNLVGGGKVRGAGTGTSDSIPAMLSNGEYVLPADTVKKVGRGALDRLRNSTHSKVKAMPKGAIAMLANGGSLYRTDADIIAEANAASQAADARNRQALNTENAAISQSGYNAMLTQQPEQQVDASITAGKSPEDVQAYNDAMAEIKQSSPQTAENIPQDVPQQDAIPPIQDTAPSDQSPQQYAMPPIQDVIPSIQALTKAAVPAQKVAQLARPRVRPVVQRQPDLSAYLDKNVPVQPVVQPDLSAYLAKNVSKNNNIGRARYAANTPFPGAVRRLAEGGYQDKGHNLTEGLTDWATGKKDFVLPVQPVKPSAVLESQPSVPTNNSTPTPPVDVGVEVPKGNNYKPAFAYNPGTVKEVKMPGNVNSMPSPDGSPTFWQDKARAAGLDNISLQDVKAGIADHGDPQYYSAQNVAARNASGSGSDLETMANSGIAGAQVAGLLSRLRGSAAKRAAETMNAQTGRMNAASNAQTGMISALAHQKSADVSQQMQDTNAQHVAGQMQSSALDNQSKQLALDQANRIDAMHQQIYAEKDPVKRQSMVDSLNELTGKPGRFTATQQKIYDPTTGAVTGERTIMVDNHRGTIIDPEVRQAASAAPHPDGTKLKGRDGKTYVVKNGVPVPA